MSENICARGRAYSREHERLILGEIRRHELERAPILLHCSRADLAVRAKPGPGKRKRDATKLDDAEYEASVTSEVRAGVLEAIWICRDRSKHEFLFILLQHGNNLSFDLCVFRTCVAVRFHILHFPSFKLRFL